VDASVSRVGLPRAALRALLARTVSTVRLEPAVSRDRMVTLAAMVSRDTVATTGLRALVAPPVALV